MEIRDSPDNGMVVLKIAVSVKFHKIRKESVNIVCSHRTVFLSGNLHTLPCVQ